MLETLRLSPAFRNSACWAWKAGAVGAGLGFRLPQQVDAVALIEPGAAAARRGCGN